jgi:methyltransferase (TIGR00027 family)
MRKGYSRTADAVALARALQQSVPPSQRILDDPYAAAFIQSPYLRFVAGSRLSSLILSSVLDFWATGGQEFVAIRARLADDQAKEMASFGLKQLVLLGAGFDSMALRIKDWLVPLTVFEVDHPETQSVKVRVMTRLGTPSNVRFVGVDFEGDDFVEKLTAAGFDRTRLSLIVWMGVSYYLTPQAMSRTLTQLTLACSPGSRLIFDYILQGVIDRTSRNAMALMAARRVALVGEPWIFGLKPEEVARYLERFGFKLIKDHEPEELRQMYCPLRFKPMDYARIVVCEREAVLPEPPENR